MKGVMHLLWMTTIEVPHCAFQFHAPSSALYVDSATPAVPLLSKHHLKPNVVVGDHKRQRGGYRLVRITKGNGQVGRGRGLFHAVKTGSRPAYQIT